MTDEDALLAAMSARPDDNHLRLVYADWLDDRGDPRGELIRLLHTLTQSVEAPDRDRREDRLRSLVASGVRPVGPFLTNSLGMRFAWIPAGTCLMGSPKEEEDRSDEETQHRVTLTQGFHLGIHPVTQAAWRTVMGNNPSHFLGDDHPVERVSWEDCQEFLRKLSASDGRAYRLPTEAEWEFACRAGTTTPFHFGTACNGEQANCDGNSPKGTDTPGPYLKKTSPVGSYAPNAFGLYDMHGNVYQLCADWFVDYPEEATTDPRALENGEERVMRGGSWFHQPVCCRAASRCSSAPEDRYDLIGFRVAFRLD